MPRIPKRIEVRSVPDSSGAQRKALLLDDVPFAYFLNEGGVRLSDWGPTSTAPDAPRQLCLELEIMCFSDDTEIIGLDLPEPKPVRVIEAKP
jgi:hypothetical protein